MSEHILVPTPWGDLTFDQERPARFDGQAFPTYDEAQAALATLDKRCQPFLRQTSEGYWAILQERPEEGETA